MAETNTQMEALLEALLLQHGYDADVLRSNYKVCLESFNYCGSNYQEYLHLLLLGINQFAATADEEQRRSWLESEYPLYVAKYGFITFDAFSARFASRYNPYSFSDWFPGVNCDDNSETMDYCGKKYFHGNFSSFPDWGAPEIPECPGFVQLYQDISVSHSKPVFLLDTLLKTRYADSELQQLLESKGITLSTVCSPMVSAYNELLEEVSRHGLRSWLGIERFARERIGQGLSGFPTRYNKNYPYCLSDWRYDFYNQ